MIYCELFHLLIKLWFSFLLIDEALSTIIKFDWYFLLFCITIYCNYSDALFLAVSDQHSLEIKKRSYWDLNLNPYIWGIEVKYTSCSWWNTQNIHADDRSISFKPNFFFNYLMPYLLLNLYAIVIQVVVVW